LRDSGRRVARLHFSQLWPFPADGLGDNLRAAGRCFVIENNATAQLAGLICRETGVEVRDQITRYDGRPFSPAGIVEEIRKRL